MAKGPDDDTTIFGILSDFGHILLGDEEDGLIFVWGGEREFHVFQHGGRGIWYRVDNWTVAAKPLSLESAMDRCRERLSEIMADQGMNEYHDMLVDKRKARRETQSTLRFLEEQQKREGSWPESRS